MKVLIFGATGATGSILTKLLLDKGYDVTAYVRNPDRMAISHERLDLIVGDIFDSEGIGRVMTGHDVVMSCLGSSTTKASDQLTRMAQSITGAMKIVGVKRVVYMATAGIEDEFKGPFKWFIRMLLGNVIDDHRGAADLYKQEGFDYTIIRPMQLKNGEPTGDYEIAEEGLPKRKKAVSRANVAEVMVKVMEDEYFVKKSIALAE